MRSEEIQAQKNKVLTTLSCIGKEYHITFEMLVNRHANIVRSVLILTEGNAKGEGSRLPGVYVTPKLLDIRSSVNGKWNHFTKVVDALKEGTWIKVEVQQLYKDNKVKTYESVLTT